MNRHFFAFCLAGLLSVCSLSTVQAAPISKLLGGTFTTANQDFLSIGAANLPLDFYLRLTFDDNGLFTAGQLTRTDGSVLASLDTANAGWSLGNATSPALDTLTVLANFGTVQTRLINFTLSAPGNTISDTNLLTTNVDRFFGNGGGPTITPLAITFQNLLGQGYQGTITAVPEPGTLGLLLSAVAGVGFIQRRRRK